MYGDINEWLDDELFKTENFRKVKKFDCFSVRFGTGRLPNPLLEHATPTDVFRLKFLQPTTRLYCIMQERTKSMKTARNLDFSKLVECAHTITPKKK
jgi:hypothetical protein